ncbi:Blue-light photoreceptor PHR2 [Monoraphidium neglectum]|uniref:Blue-light photoreceptor PHR2 n=1 Tax=Monoraphidium neglectum TaxID=145388 RepID=A0A0D2J304_9CHLO|nr:Blue-light photoreceptor PHR2 [Monoraphidium neglectum]KIY94367.1 Blue-light photoreceptor PHR2 [Monoraphidium neglectum]|eukprot:XP_013893387.1 Blue-light photoreceptor PHR2 [Monoraphidium neglectum]
MAQAPGAFSRTGPYRAAFVLGAVAALRAALRDRGSELVVRVGRPEEVLPQLAARVGAGRVYCHAEAGPEERAVEAAVARGLDEQGAALQVLWGGTLFHPDDLPFKPAAAPECAIAPGDLPTLAQLGLRRAALQRARADTAAAGARLRGGGERDALAHVQAFAREVQQGGAAARPSPAFAGRVAPWLDVGCLSPRSLYHALQGQLAPHGDGAQRGGLSWLLFELMWRDFHRFLRFKAAVTQGQLAARQAPVDATPGSLPLMAMA